MKNNQDLKIWISLTKDSAKIRTKQGLKMVAFLVILIVGVFLYTSCRAVRAGLESQQSEVSQNDLATKLIGTWILEEAENPGTPSGIGTRLLFFSETYFCVVQPDPNTGMIVFQHGGPYVLEGSELRETIEFAGSSTMSFMGMTTTLQIQINDDTFKQVDSNGRFNETWRRVK